MIMADDDDGAQGTSDEAKAKFSTLVFAYEKVESLDAFSKTAEEQRRLGQAEHPTRKKESD